MKKRIFRLAVVLLLVVSPLIAQNAGGNVVQIVSYWEPGDSHSYTLELGTEMSLLAGETSSYTSYHVLVEVLERTTDGYLMQWTYTDAVAPPGADAFEQRIVEINEDFAVRYFITDLGEFVGVENWPEISDVVHNAMAAISNEFAGQPDIDRSIATIMRAFESKDSFESLAMDEIKFYHMLHGYSYLMDDPLIVEGEATNPFGGTPIRAKTTIELSEVNSERSTAYLIYTRTFDPQSLTRAVFEVMNGYLPESELTSDQTAGLPAFDMRIRKQFIFHTDSGWLLEAYSERYAETDGERRTDSIYIEFLE